MGTQYAEQYGCPAGTYGNRTMLASSDDCNDCDGGMFCGSSGLSTPTNQCLAGSFCTSKANISAPRDGISGDICPLGHYCPPGTTVPFKCDEGTYGPEEGDLFSLMINLFLYLLQLAEKRNLIITFLFYFLILIQHIYTKR